MIRPFRRAALAAAVLSLAACAVQPAPKAPAAKVAAKAPAPPPPTFVHLVCNQAARTVRFADLGVPEGEAATAVALTPRYVWVLFRPARLLRLDRAGGSTVQMLVGQDGEAWDALAADPLDGSAWIGEVHPFSLHHVSPDLRQTDVHVEHVIGDGEFQGLLVARDAIYMSAVGAKDRAWRLDRQGHVLSKAFPEPAEQAGIEPRSPVRGPSMLFRDGEGGIFFWDEERHRAFAPDASGAWVERPLSWYRDAPFRARGVKGAGVGSASEMWYLDESPLRRLFFWKGRPVFLASHARGLKASAIVLEVPPAAEGGETRELFEPCDGLYDVASDATGYAALVARGVVVGDFATAPDLP